MPQTANATGDLDRLVKTGAVARAIGVSTRSVRSWCESGRLKSTLLPDGKHYHISIRDAMAFAKEYALRFDPFKL